MVCSQVRMISDLSKLMCSHVTLLSTNIRVSVFNRITCMVAATGRIRYEVTGGLNLGEMDQIGKTPTTKKVEITNKFMTNRGMTEKIQLKRAHICYTYFYWCIVYSIATIVSILQ